MVFCILGCSDTARSPQFLWPEPSGLSGDEIPTSDGWTNLLKKHVFAFPFPVPGHICGTSLRDVVPSAFGDSRSSKRGGCWPQAPLRRARPAIRPGGAPGARRGAQHCELPQLKPKIKLGPETRPLRVSWRKYINQPVPLLDLTFKGLGSVEVSVGCKITPGNARTGDCKAPESWAICAYYRWGGHASESCSVLLERALDCTKSPPI